MEAIDSQAAEDNDAWKNKMKGTHNNMAILE